MPYQDILNYFYNYLTVIWFRILLVLCCALKNHHSENILIHFARQLSMTHKFNKLYFGETSDLFWKCHPKGAHSEVGHLEGLVGSAHWWTNDFMALLKRQGAPLQGMGYEVLGTVLPLAPPLCLFLSSSPPWLPWGDPASPQA